MKKILLSPLLLGLFLVTVLGFYWIPEILINEQIRNLGMIRTNEKAFEFAVEEIDFIKFRMGAAFSIIGFVVFLLFKAEGIELLNYDKIDLLVGLSVTCCFAAICIDITSVHTLHYIMWYSISFEQISSIWWFNRISEVLILISVLSTVLLALFRSYNKG